MTDDRLAEIAALYAETKRHDQLYGSEWVNAACACVSTVPELIAEVERGRAKVAQLESEAEDAEDMAYADSLLS